MSIDTQLLPLIQLEGRFRRVKAQLKKLFNLFWRIEKAGHPLRLHDHFFISNRINDLIRLMIADIKIHLNIRNQPWSKI